MAETGQAWRVADLVIHRLAENETCRQPLEDLLPGLTRQGVLARADWLGQDALDPVTGILYRSYHSYVVETPQHRVLVDTCIGNQKNLAHRPDWHRKNDARWLDAFAATGLTFADIDYVLFTHLHIDHVGWNTRRERGRWVPTFPNARHLVVAEEYHSAVRWPGMHPGHPSAEVFRTSFAESVAPVMAAGKIDLVTADYALGDYFRYLPMRGHTLGHSAIAVGKGGRDAAVFAGDLFHSPVQTVFPDAKVPYDDDPDLAARTRRSFLTRYAGTDTLVCTAHFPAPSVGYVRPAGPGFQFVFTQPATNGQ
jgi:glyoxylase-like metal-dependent hydrolase (beta-lactamase superfamily II)